MLNHPDLARNVRGYAWIDIVQPLLCILADRQSGICLGHHGHEIAVIGLIICMRLKTRLIRSERELRPDRIDGGQRT